VIIVTHDVEFVAECSPRVLLMREGRIVADGEAKEVLSDQDILAQASIVPPQITQIFLELHESGLPTDVIDVYEAQRILLDRLEKKHR
jgi:energy-coupling factor transport system ATP-binding protein